MSDDDLRRAVNELAKAWDSTEFPDERTAALMRLDLAQVLAAHPVPSPAGQDEEAAVEHDHPGLDCAESWSYCWPCPKCGVCKFIGHGPLCNECHTRPAPAVDEEA